MSGHATDRNLLFGVIALQLSFISRDDLIGAMGAWALEKSKPLGQILRERGVLPADTLDLLEALVGKHLEQHGQDAGASLRALPPVALSRCELAQISDSEAQETLARFDTAPTDEAEATIPLPPRPVGSAARFRVLRSHAKGGLGEIFVAEDLELHRQVAFKEIQTQHLFDAHSRERFIAEAEITGRLEHPGVVPVYGMGTHPDGRPYYAMRFIQGENLNEAIRRFHATNWRHAADENAALRQLLRRFVDVCNAIAYAHSRGILHRDLKPSNVMLGEFGETLVVDWGLAKALGHREPAAATRKEGGTLVPRGGSSQVTEHGEVLGTPAFMSPEQAAGRSDEIGPLSDVYSLGATLYAILAGCPPFTGSVNDVLPNVIQGKFAAPSQVRQAVSPKLEVICLKAMSLRPADRQASCLELAADVEHWLGVEARQKERRLRLDAELQHARSHYERAYSHIERDDFISCLLWLARTLEALNGVLADFDADDDPDQHQRLESLAQSSRLGVAAYLHGLPTLQAMYEHPAGVTCLVVNSSETRLITGCHDRVARVWHLDKDGSRASELRHESPVTAVAIAPDEGAVYTGTDDGTLHAWDVASRKPLWKSDGLGEFVRSICVASDGARLACATSRCITWVDAHSGQSLDVAFERRAHRNRWRCLAISPDGSTLAAGGDDNIARLWDVRERRHIGGPLVHAGRVNCICFCTDGTSLVTGSEDGTAQIWNVSTQQPIGDPLQHADAVLAVAFCDVGLRVATGCRDRSARIWEAATSLQVGPSMVHSRAVSSVAFSAVGAKLLTGCSDGKVLAWSLPKIASRVVELPHPTPEPVRRGAFSADGRTVLTIGGDFVTRQWDSSTGVLLPFPVSSPFAFGPGGVAFPVTDGSLRVWDCEHRRPVPRWSELRSSASILGFNPDWSIVAVVENDQEFVILCDTLTGESIGAPLPHAMTFPVLFSPDGRVLITARTERAVQVWKTAWCRPLGDPLTHTDLVLCGAFSQNGETLITGCIDGTAWLWDVTTGALLGEPLRHGAPVRVVAILKDGQIAVTSGDDGYIRLWDALTGKALGLPHRHGAEAWSVGFSLDGSKAIVGCAKGIARILPLPSLNLEGTVRQVRVWIETHTGQRLNEHGVREFLSESQWQARRRELPDLGGPPARE